MMNSLSYSFLAYRESHDTASPLLNSRAFAIDRQNIPLVLAHNDTLSVARGIVIARQRQTLCRFVYERFSLFTGAFILAHYDFDRRHCVDDIDIDSALMRLL